jgi:alpha-maltose-1-phosphate synthase
MGVPSLKTSTFPWVQVPFMAAAHWGAPEKVVASLRWAALESLDRYASRRLDGCDALIALSGAGLHAGRKISERGGIFICDRGSVHIDEQERLLQKEYARLKLEYSGMDCRVIQKERAEYALADAITVPSRFAAQTFVAMGIPKTKLHVIPYGVDKELFFASDKVEDEFTVLTVGGISVRKAGLRLLQAFSKLKAKKKRLIVVGGIHPLLRAQVDSIDKTHMTFIRHVDNKMLGSFYRSASVFVQCSIEDGFGMTVLEALSSGCPVIASKTVGAAEWICHDKTGLVLVTPDDLVTALEQVAADSDFRRRTAALRDKLPSWDDYGAKYQQLLNAMCKC